MRLHLRLRLRLLLQGRRPLRKIKKKRKKRMKRGNAEANQQKGNACSSTPIEYNTAQSTTPFPTHIT
jgi:hypothetical protein